MIGPRPVGLATDSYPSDAVMSLAERTWVLLTEAPDGGWGLAGHANTNEELIAAARAQIAEPQAQKPDG
jgi:hypothetical protein